MTDPSPDILPVLTKSPIHVELFAFFLRNRGIHIRAENLARSLGRPLLQVEQALDDFVEQGWIARRPSVSGDSIDFHGPTDLGGDTEASLDTYLAILRSAARDGQ